MKKAAYFLFACLIILMLSGCTGAKKQEKAIKIRLLNFDQVVSQDLKIKGYIKNSLYLGFEFIGYDECPPSSYPRYSARVEGRGEIKDILKYNENYLSPYGVVEGPKLNSMQYSPRNCYLEAMIPDAFTTDVKDNYGNCYLKNLYIDASDDTQRDAIGHAIFTCDDVMKVMQGSEANTSPNNTSPNNNDDSKNKPKQEAKDLCSWEDTIVGTWAFDADKNYVTYQTYMADGTYTAYQVIDGKKHNSTESNLTWRCLDNGAIELKWKNAPGSNITEGSGVHKIWFSDNNNTMTQDKVTAHRVK